MIRTLGLAVVALGVLHSAPLAAQSPGPLAVVVNRANPVSGLTLDQLRQYYLGASTLFPNRERAVLLEYQPDRQRFYHVAVSMGEDRVKRHWIRRVFAGEVGTPPDEYRDLDELVRTVASRSGAIAFIPLAAVTPALKVVPIDGKRPGEPGYAFP